MKLVVALLFLMSSLAAAQSSGAAVVAGRVVDESKTPIAGAKVELVGIDLARSDTAGMFRFAQVPPGTFIVRVTMLGFQPVLKAVTIAAGRELRLDISMSPSAQALSAVVVREDSSTSLLADPSGFEERRKRSRGGHFISAEEIERKHPTETEQLFHGLPSVHVDTGGIVVVKRGEISPRDIYLSKKDVNPFNTCIGAQVFVDGVAMAQPFNINTISVTSIRGIEIYSGPATTPAQLRSSKTTCGTIAIWMKAN